MRSHLPHVLQTQQPPPAPPPPPRIKWLIWQARKTIRAAAETLHGLGADGLAQGRKGPKLPTTKVLQAVCSVFYDDSSAKDRNEVLTALRKHMRSNLGALLSSSDTADGSTGDADPKCGEGRSSKKAATPQQDRDCEGEHEAQQEEGEEESEEESEEEGGIACEVCDETENGLQMLLCDQCDKGYHTYCVGLADIPEGNW